MLPWRFYALRVLHDLVVERPIGRMLSFLFVLDLPVIPLADDCLDNVHVLLPVIYLACLLLFLRGSCQQVTVGGSGALRHQLVPVRFFTRGIGILFVGISRPCVRRTLAHHKLFVCPVEFFRMVSILTWRRSSLRIFRPFFITTVNLDHTQNYCADEQTKRKANEDKQEVPGF